ncbi:hypothetical protein BC828DRAFT_407184 [Blastocladiella britannica]|nr:hypothetical protein BC828DRAFT_407184 [Blastocladiella britannica]
MALIGSSPPGMSDTEGLGERTTAGGVVPYDPEDLGYVEGDATEPTEMTLEHMISSLKSGLYGVLFVVIKESRMPTFMVVIMMIVDGLQASAFAFNEDVGFSWENAGWFHSLLGLLSFDEVLQASAGRAAYYFALGLLGVVLLNAIYVGYSFFRNHIRFIWTLKTLRMLLSICVTSLFIPIVSVLTKSVITCTDTTTGMISPCWSGSFLVGSIATTIIGVVFIILTFIVTSTFFEQEPAGKDVLARPHARIDLLHLAIRTYLTILFALIRRHDAADLALRPLSDLERWLLVLSLVAGSFLSMSAYAYYQPYFRHRFCLLQTTVMAWWNFACLCLLYWNLRPQANKEMGILAFLFGPIYAGLIGSLQHLRRRQLLRTDVRDISDPLSIELKTRIHLEEKGLLFKMNEVQLADAAANNTPLNDLAVFERVKDINGMWAEAVRLMPDKPLVYLFWAEFYLLYLKNKHMALTYYGRAEEASSALDVQFLVFRRRKILSDNFSGDAINLIAYEQHLSAAVQYQTRVTRAQIKFWGELLKKSHDMARLHLLAEAISSGISKTQENFIRVLKLNPNSPQVLRQYALFLIEVMNDHKNGRELQERADDLDEQGGEEEEGDEHEELDINLFSDENSVITISGAYDTVGRILHVNNKALSVLGYRRSELLNQNITTIVPAPFAEPHDEFMRLYLETGFSKIVERTRKVLAMHRNGYLIPVALAVKQVSRNKSTAFLGVIKPIQHDDDIIILDENEIITSFTEGITKYFNVMPREIESKIHISQVLPKYNEMKDQYKSRTGGVCEYVDRKGQPMQIEAQISVTELPRPRSTGIIKMCMVVFRISTATAIKENANLNGDSDTGSIAQQSVASTSLSRKADQPLGFMDPAEGSSTSLAHTGSVGSGRKKSKLRRAPSESGQSRGSRGSSAGGISTNSPEYVKAVLVRKNITVTKNLRWLRASFLLAIFLLIGLAVRSHLTTVALYEKTSVRLQQVKNEHLIAEGLVTIAYGARTIELVNTGLLASAANFAWGLAQVTAGIAQIGMASNVLLSTLSQSTYYQQYLTQSQVHFAEVLTSGQRSIGLGLMDAVGRVQATASLILASPRSILARYMSVITSNAPFALPVAIEGHTDGFRNEFVEIQAALNMEALISVLPVIVYLVTVILLVRPIYSLIQHERDGFLAMFSAIPHHVVRGIQSQWIRRLEKMTGDDDESGDAGDAGSRAGGSQIAASGNAGVTLGKATVRESTLNIGSSTFQSIVNHKEASTSHLNQGGHGRAPSTASKELPPNMLHRMVLWWMDVFAAIKRGMHRKYTMLFAVTAAYFAASSVMAFNFQSTWLTSSQEFKWFTRLPILVRQVSFYMQEAVVSPPSPTFPLASTLATIDGLNQEILTICNALVYGNATMEVSGVALTQAKGVALIYLDNACSTGSTSPANCLTFDNGVLSSGLYATMIEYNALVSQALGLITAGGVTLASLSTADPFKTIRDLDQIHLPPILDQVSTLYSESSSEGLNYFIWIHLIVTVAYPVVLLGMYVLYYRPHLAQLGSSIMRKHVMLYLIPSEVITNVESIQRYLRS